MADANCVGLVIHKCNLYQLPGINYIQHTKGLIYNIRAPYVYRDGEILD